MVMIPQVAGQAIQAAAPRPQVAGQAIQQAIQAAAPRPGTVVVPSYGGLAPGQAPGSAPLNMGAAPTPQRPVNLPPKDREYRNRAGINAGELGSVPWSGLMNL